MKKVKEYCDKYLYSVGDNTCDLKANSHYCVHGAFVYPKNWKGSNFEDVLDKNYKCSDHISITINNETIIVGNISVDGIWSIYHYLQTYAHIPRGEADINGYYRRSTGDEIIRYIDGYLQQIKKRQREKKLERILNIY